MIDFLTSSGLRDFITQSVKYSRLSAERVGLYDKLRKMLGEKQFIVFDKFANLTIETESETSEEYFIH